jgi:hypothetical protein
MPTNVYIGSMSGGSTLVSKINSLRILFDDAHHKPSYDEHVARINIMPSDV